MRSQKKVFTKASDRIRMEIEEAIKDGSLLPGESVDEAELALQYDVSRTPVREALLQLQAQGLLTSLPRGGMIVAKMDLQQLLSLWELLAELEGVAVRLACQRMTPEELDIIVRHHEASRKVAEADDVAGWQESNLRFHELIYRATRNPYLRQEVLRMRTRTGYYRRHAFAALGQIRNSFEQHRRVVEAFQKGDAESASSAMVDHMRPASDANGLTDFIVNLPKEVLAP
ncbi:GntR family transcriptional regulator [Pigmentiphaga litoralis]|uniref:DNA-binding GntR family transcriptional regulator n=1 Tax=Pigmentiphaga litoralis TaxID=516702 RepID=A0A7Y9IS93_9BURK|nr:GntR family transcriptional regulator [Pigmentiphaga litoralis]NYE24491.1 DNA-binding GntR family transcriptional regulator [Pigmentiphaga litoralis]NYE81895.1 DNA-binding GntR family transcriptional regulator [Pigmentiphaga litoralis]